MKTNVALFVLSFAVAFGGGYMYFDGSSDQVSEPAAVEQSDKGTDKAKSADKAAANQPTAQATSAEAKIFADRGCVSCHSVSSLGVKGGEVAPDLSKAYINVEGKHGVPIEEFLKKPTTAVMSGVLGSAPLSDEEMKAILAGLKAASEK